MNIHIRPHDPRVDRFTKITNATYRAGSTCPLFLQSTLEWMDGKADRHRAFLDLLASTVFGEPQDRRLFIFKGDGSNGKSSCLRIVRQVLGSYVGELTAKSIARNNRSGAEHTADLAAIVGCRVVFVTESGGTVIDEGLLKEMSGGDLIKWRNIREKQGKPFRMGRLILLCNDMPKIRIDHAMRQRLCVVPFDREFPDDPTFNARLAAEADGILTLFVDRYRQTGGVVEPSADMLLATEEETRNLVPERTLAEKAFVFTGDDSDWLPVTAIIEAANRAQAAEPVGFARPWDGRVAKEILPALGAIYRRGRPERDGRPAHFRRVRLRTAKDWCT